MNFQKMQLVFFLLFFLIFIVFYLFIGCTFFFFQERGERLKNTSSTGANENKQQFSKEIAHFIDTKRKHELHIESRLSEINQEYGTPAYVYDEESLIKQAKSALKFPNAYGLMVSINVDSLIILFNYSRLFVNFRYVML